jgi:putative phosphotransacetylase
MSNAPARSEVETLVRQITLEYFARTNTKIAPTLTVHASARHMHLSREDLEALFGPGYELTVDRPLFQEGNFAAKETVTLVGPRSRLISNLRVLGPLRSRSQVELAFTDAVSLGLDIPIRLSGDIAGTPGAYIMGPRGVIKLNEGVIRAAIHVHMNLRIGGDAGITFNRVHVRIDERSKLNVHMDTDEANACGLHLAKEIELTR